MIPRRFYCDVEASKLRTGDRVRTVDKTKWVITERMQGFPIFALKDLLHGEKILAATDRKRLCKYLWEMDMPIDPKTSKQHSEHEGD